MPDAPGAGPAWRPTQTIRVKVVAIARHDDSLLVCEVLNDDGTVKGWCPLGGGVEFGETAAEALQRELHEELGCDTVITGPPLLCENIYEHYGQTGHEIVLAFPVRFADQRIYQEQRFQIREDSGTMHWVEWKALARLRSGDETLYPVALAAQLFARADSGTDALAPHVLHVTAVDALFSSNAVESGH